jgi:polyhydroxyalkanoate synthesis regulator protein
MEEPEQEEQEAQADLRMLRQYANWALTNAAHSAVITLQKNVQVLRITKNSVHLVNRTTIDAWTTFHKHMSVLIKQLTPIIVVVATLDAQPEKSVLTQIVFN